MTIFWEESPSMMLHLGDKLALVTASTGGIGKETATSLAREGATVIVNGRTAASVDAAIADIRARVPGAKLEKKEVADFITYVSSPLASAINGAALRVDGGLVRSVF